MRGPWPNRVNVGTTILLLFLTRAVLALPSVANVAPFVDQGLREMANVTLNFTVAGSGSTFTAFCPAEGVEPSCSSVSLRTPQASGSIDESKTFQIVTVPNVPYANATGRYACAISVQTSDGPADCQLVSVPPPEVQPRINIVSFMSTTYLGMRNLLLLSLAEIQSRPTEDATGYFALAGIHGRNVSYNGTEQMNNITEGVGGWCQHGNGLFPPFHRAYQAQMEKAVRHYAEQIALQYEDPELRDYFVSNARKLRLPYWDWASEDTVAYGVPPIFLADKLAVRPPPLAEPKFIANPLRNYTFPEKVAFYGDVRPRANVLEFKTYLVGESTFRHPDFLGRVSNDTLMNSNVRFAAQSTWVPGVYDMFRTQTDYGQFSNHFGTVLQRPNDSSVRYGEVPSLELFHDNIHDTVGGWGGTMHYVPMASFDPIFWFHHNNVERQFELWQLMNPDSWIIPSINLGPDSMSTITGQTYDGDTPIPPFRDASGAFVTANSLRDLRSKTSTYPDVKLLMDSGLSPELIREAVLEGISVAGEISKQFNTSYALEVNATVRGNVPVSEGTIHVFLLPDKPPSAGKKTNDPSYCGSVELSTIGDAEASTLPIDECMRARGVNFYPTLNYVIPPWSEKDMLDPTRRFRQNDAGAGQWALQNDTFMYTVEGADGTDLSDYVTFGEPTTYYTYNTEGLAIVNKAAAPPQTPQEIFWDELNARTWNGTLPNLLEEYFSFSEGGVRPPSPERETPASSAPLLAGGLWALIMLSATLV